jgi:hypothetical protein
MQFYVSTSKACSCKIAEPDGFRLCFLNLSSRKFQIFSGKL